MHSANFTALSWPVGAHGEYKSWVMTIQGSIAQPTAYRAHSLGTSAANYLLAAARNSKPKCKQILAAYPPYFNQEPTATLLSDAIIITSQYLVAWMQSTTAPLARLTTGLAWAPGSGAVGGRLFYVTANGVHELSYDFGWINDAASPPGVALPESHGALAAPDERNVFYVGVDKHVHCLQHDTLTARWTHIDLTIKTEDAELAALRSGLAAPNAHLVFYVGTDHHVHCLQYDTTKTLWTHTDVTTKDAPRAGDESGLAAPDERNVFYVGVDKHVHCLQHDTLTARWTHTDVTPKDAPPAAAENGLAAPDSHHVFYFGTVGADKHAHCLWYDTSTHLWTHTDVTPKYRSTCRG